ncbi:SCO family protein [Arenimonas oryziterrae]|uniref:Thioredoxin domain-containing protein n=1 Tax=Arenimonas oryziterrae DSM 21050 = YC6267 TaxID=1121015 RepID=A0A091BL06_9GAMM|nr:SCO family protein [Arenimonas oryziterrae]KFN45005.1 hypothetical protein N789_03010 [Arenimonas oryziterrae DSM 21050 = YC6267]
MKWPTLLSLLLAPALAFAATQLAPDSVWQSPGQYTAQNQQAFRLADRRGSAQIVGMFYSACPYMCPLIIDTGLGIDHALTPAERTRLRVLLVSIDPGRDTPAVLSALAKKRRLDTTRWTLARTDEDSVRKLAAVLGVRYRRLASGDYNHTSALILLDAEGRIVARTEHMGATPDPAFLAAVHRTLAARSK